MVCGPDKQYAHRLAGENVNRRELKKFSDWLQGRAFNEIFREAEKAFDGCACEMCGREDKAVYYFDFDDFSPFVCAACIRRLKIEGVPDTPPQGSLRLRFLVLQRDGFRCRYCGRGPEDGTVLHVDHVVPKAQGGRDDMDNLVTACRECNLGKSDVLLEAHKQAKDGPKGG
jgi:hypothetical protein